MTDTITPLYEKFLRDVKEQIPVLDPDLAIRVLQIQSSLHKLYPTRSKPHVHLYVKYKDGVQYQEKVDKIRDKYPIQTSVSRWNDGVILSGLMNIGTVQTICGDPDIIEVKGEANARHS